MRPVTKVNPPAYPYFTIASLNVGMLFTANAMKVVYNQPVGFVRSIRWVVTELLQRRVKNLPFPNPSTPANRAAALERMATRLEPYYGEARNDLTQMLGTFCSFCELPLGAHLFQVEHVVPKAPYPTFTVWWANYLLACRDCNACKLSKPARAQATIWAGVVAPTEVQLRTAVLNSCYWPHIDAGTFRVFRRIYSVNTPANPAALLIPASYSSVNNALVSFTLDTVHANVQFAGAVRLNRPVDVRIVDSVGSVRSARTLPLTGLQRANTGRSACRTQVWLLACLQVRTLLATTAAIPLAPAGLRTTVFDALWDALLDAAVARGFYSVWIDVLRRHPFPAGVANPNAFASLGLAFVWHTNPANNANVARVFPGTNLAQVP